MEARMVALNRFIRGWMAYFALSDTPSISEELDEWLRPRLRQVRLKEWKQSRARARNLRALGIPVRQANEWSYTRPSGPLARRRFTHSPASFAR